MSNHLLSLASCAILLCLVSLGCSAASNYYVSPAGDDANPGTEAKPWRSVAKVNETDLEPGDRVLFEGGKTFIGPVALTDKHSGSAGKRVEFSSYGAGRATIDGGNGIAFTATGCNHLTVRNLNFIGNGRKTGNTENGVFLTKAEEVEVDQIEISGFRTNGLLLMSVRKARITQVYAHDNGASGITVGIGEPDWSEHVYIGYCVAENNPGDPSNLENHSGSGIVVGSVRDCLIEYCEAMNNGWDMPPRGNGPVGIWAWNADRVTIQFCVSHDNKSTGGDGGGFDLDGGVTNSVMQYNYSYYNMGPGFFLCQYPTAPVWKNNIVRYNVSVNDGYKNDCSGINVYGGDERMSDAEVYNNTVYNTKGGAVGLSGIPAPRIRFRNNIFVTGAVEMIRGDASPSRFERNLYWVVDPSGVVAGEYKTLAEWAKATGQEMVEGKLVGLWADPLLTELGTMPHIAPTDLSKLLAYRLQPGSPGLKAGLTIEDNGGRDFWGTKVPEVGKPSIGACQEP